MRAMCCLVPCVVLLLAIAAAPARAAVTCRFISDHELAGAMPAAKWSLVSDQDGRGCIYQGQRGDTLMLTVFRNPSQDRAKELYATFVKTLEERLAVIPWSGIGDEAQARKDRPGCGACGSLDRGAVGGIHPVDQHLPVRPPRRRHAL